MGANPDIVGVGMTRFGKHLDRSLADLGGEAVDAAMRDADVSLGDIDMAFVANAMSGVVTGQSSVVGQTMLRAKGFWGIPVYNIDNACAGSSSALNLAVQAIRAGSARTVLVVGAEKLYSAERVRAFRALNGAVDSDILKTSGIDPDAGSVFVASIYPKRIAEYERCYGLDPNAMAAISVKNRRNAGSNPVAQYTDPITEEDVLSSRSIVGSLTALMCAPIGDGASAVVVTSDRSVAARCQPVRIAASVVGMGGGGQAAIRRLAGRAYEEAGLHPGDVDLAEVHDSIAFNELLASEELGFCGPGEGGALALAGETSFGGRIPLNTSGGLESRGHPVAATGLAQIYELALQLRGGAGERQLISPAVGLAENAGGFARDDTAAVAITILRV
ncbi:thiolase family protein [Amorphus sp. MBR-141]